MVPERHRVLPTLSSLGHTIDRSLSMQGQPQMHSFLLPSWDRQCFCGGCVHDRLVQRFPLHVSTNTTHPMGDHPTSTVQSECNPHSSEVAQTTLVHSPDIDVSGLVLSSLHPRPSDTQPRDGLPPRPNLSQSHGLEDMPAVTAILVQARKPSTRSLYESKWK